MMLIEEIVESLCVQTPIIIQNVCVLLGDHRSLCMTGIALHGFDIAAVQLELVCNAGVSEAVENHFGEIPFLKAGNNDTPFVVYQNDFKEILMKQPIAVCFAKAEKLPHLTNRHGGFGSGRFSFSV